MPKIKNIVCVAMVLPLLACATPRAVSKSQFDDLVAHWNEPKLSTWWYMGTKDGFHFFYYQDLGNVKGYYKVAEAELKIEKPFGYSRNRKWWVPMPWGARAL